MKWLKRLLKIARLVTRDKSCRWKIQFCLLKNSGHDIYFFDQNSEYGVNEVLSWYCINLMVSFRFWPIGRFRFPCWRKFWTRDITSSCVIWRHAFKPKFRRSKQTWKSIEVGLQRVVMTSHSDVHVQVNVYLNLPIISHPADLEISSDIELYW